MNYKNWDNRKTNKGKGRGNWNWRGRGYNRMSTANPFLQNLPWSNSANYNLLQLLHNDTNVHYYNSKYQKPSHLPSTATNVIVPKLLSPLPGSEEYTQNKIQQTSDLIKRQLNIDNETCSVYDVSSNTGFTECLTNNNDEKQNQNNPNLALIHDAVESKRLTKQFPKKNKNLEIINVQEIHDKIIKHIASLSYSKKMNLVNQSTFGYDIAIQEVQKQKRLELSRALRDMSKRQAQTIDDGEVINAIIPDIGIKIEELPNDIIAELSNSLNLDLEEQASNLVDPEVCFKQAEEILNVNFDTESEVNLKRLPGSLVSDKQNNVTKKEILENIPDLMGEDCDILGKPRKECDVSDITFQKNINYRSYISQENGDHNVLLGENDFCESNVKEDYSKDVEFNNFCFENLDVSKSYLVPFTSSKCPEDININVALEQLPKIAVRKDILLNTNTDNDHKNNIHVISNIKSQIETPKYAVNSNLVQVSNIENPMLLQQKLLQDSDNSEKDNVANNLNLKKKKVYISKNHLKSKVHSNKLISTQIDCADASCYEFQTQSEGKVCSDNVDKNIPVILQTTKELDGSIQELSIGSKTGQALESCSQKRWKSPGEKKMMTDIAPIPNVILNPTLTLNTTILEQMEEFNKKMMSISPKLHINNFPQSSSSSPTDKYKMLDDNLVEEQSEGISNLSNLLIPLNARGTVQNTFNYNEGNSQLPICTTGIQDQLIENTFCEGNERKNISNHNVTDFPVQVKSTEALPQVKDNLQLSKEKKSKSLQQKAIGHIKQDVTQANPTNKSVSDAMLPFNKVKQDQLLQLMDCSVEKCSNMHQTNMKTDNCLRIDSINKDLLADKDDTRNSKKNENIKQEVNTVVSLKKENLKDHKKVKTAAEKKETSPITQFSKNVHTQTNYENNVAFETRENKCKDAETQVSASLSSSSVQTDINCESDNIKLRYANYSNYIVRLKEIDAKIEALMNIKKSIYERVECDAILNLTSSLSVDPKEHIFKKDVFEHKNKEIHKKKSDIEVRKHKKIDSEDDLETSINKSKRKKHHRSSDKNVISCQFNTFKRTRDVELLDTEKNLCEEVRKPLSIKISLKSLSQPSPKKEYQDIIKKTSDQLPDKITTKNCYLENNYDCNTSNSTINQNIVTESQSKKTGIKGRNRIDQLLNNISVRHTNRLLKEKRKKNKKLKTSEHILALPNSRLSKNEQQKILNRNCHVVIERFTIEYLENLKKSLAETIKKQRDNTRILFDETSEHNIALHESSNGSELNDVCISKETLINPDPKKSNIQFKDFTGAVLDIKIFQDVVLAATDCGVLYFFNINTGDILSSIIISEKPLTAICVSKGRPNQIYVGCLKGTLAILNFDLRETSDIVPCEEGIQCLEKEWEYIFMGSHKGHIMRYNYKKEKLENTMKIYDSNILAIKAAQEGARRIIIVASRNVQVTVRDAISGLLMRTMKCTFHPTVYTILLKDNLVYCATSQHDILVYMFQDGELRLKYEATNSKGIVCMKISRNLLFAGCYNGNIYIYSICSNKYLGQITGPGGMLLSIDVHDNKIVVGTKCNKLESFTIPEYFLSQAIIL